MSYLSHRCPPPGQIPSSGDIRSGRGPAARARRARLVAALATGVAVASLAACTGGADGTGDDQAGGPQGSAPGVVVPSSPSVIPAEDASTPTIPVPDGFVAPDTRNVVLAPVLGRPGDEPDLDANVVPVRGGEATVTVRVVGPDGRGVEGANVRFERFFGPFKGWVDVPAGRGGTAVLDDAFGGRYRVRAWEAPRLTTTEPQMVFVRQDEAVELQVRVEPHEAPVLQGALTTPTWRVDDVAAFEALLVQEEVGTDGIIRGRPLVGQVTLAPIAGARVEGESTLTTDPVTGLAVFPVVCVATGIHQAVLSGNGQSVIVFMPECLAPDPSAPPPESTTTTAPVEDDPSPSSSSTTTSTTTPPAITFPVGRTFTVPFDGPLPAGTYSTTGTEACATSYEALRDGRWQSRESSGSSIVALGPIRDLVPAGGTEPCTYRRVR